MRESFLLNDEFISTLRKLTVENKMQPTNPNAHTYVNGKDVKTHGYAVTQHTFLQYFNWTVLYIFPLLPVCSVECVVCGACRVWSVEWKV